MWVGDQVLGQHAPRRRAPSPHSPTAHRNHVASRPRFPSSGQCGRIHGQDLGADCDKRCPGGPIAGDAAAQPRARLALMGAVWTHERCFGLRYKGLFEVVHCPPAGTRQQGRQGGVDGRWHGPEQPGADSSSRHPVCAIHPCGMLGGQAIGRDLIPAHLPVQEFCADKSLRFLNSV